MSCVREKREGRFVFGASVSALAHSSINKPILRELFSSFSFTASSLDVMECDSMCFVIGREEPISCEGYEYAIAVSDSGVTVRAENERGLIHGYLAMIEMIEPIELGEGCEQLAIPATKILDKPDLEYRMVHLCLFPEMRLAELERNIRVVAMLKCTHIVLEFWGTVRFDSLAELAWRDGSYGKDEIRPLIKMANDLGIQVIPMFNHWGHASLSRGKFGKHVVLNQNPRLATMFNKSGWVWSIDKERVRELHRSIRRELIELCGAGEFFHIGCDEAIISDDESIYGSVVEYINEVADDLKSLGRRSVMWGDMLLLKSRFDKSAKYECNVRCESVERVMLDGLSRDVIVADWQYNATEHPFKTSEHLSSLGFDVVVSPWDEYLSNGTSAVATARELGLLGILHTTWHTMYRGMRPLNLILRRAWDRDYEWSDDNMMYVGALVARAYPAHTLAESGWSEKQIGTGIL